MNDVGSPESRFVMVDGSTSRPDLVSMMAKREDIWLTHAAIEINLRLPSMLHGKKGFERIVWAFTNILTGSLTWLFYDFLDDAEGLVIGKNSTSLL